MREASTMWRPLFLSNVKSVKVLKVVKVVKVVKVLNA